MNRLRMRPSRERSTSPTTRQDVGSGAPPRRPIRMKEMRPARALRAGQGPSGSGTSWSMQTRWRGRTCTMPRTRGSLYAFPGDGDAPDGTPKQRSMPVAKARSDVKGGRSPAHPVGRTCGPAGRVPRVGLPLRIDRTSHVGGRVVVADQMPPAGPHARVLVREDVTLTHQAVSALIERDRRGEGHPLAGRRAHRRFAGDIALAIRGPGCVARTRGRRRYGSVDCGGRSRVEFDPKERLLEFAVPRTQFGVDVPELPLSDQVVLPTGHWLQPLGEPAWPASVSLATLAGRNVVSVAWNLGTAIIAYDPWTRESSRRLVRRVELPHPSDRSGRGMLARR